MVLRVPLKVMRSRQKMLWALRQYTVLKAVAYVHIWYIAMH